MMRPSIEPEPRRSPSEAPPRPLSSSAPSVRVSKPSVPLAAPRELPKVKLGIRVKLVALMVATISAIVVALASYFPARQISELRAGLKERASVYADLASRQLRSSVAFNDQETAREVLGAVAKDPLIDSIAVYTAQGVRLHAEGHVSELAHAARNGLGETRVFALPGRVLAMAPVVSLEGPRGTVVIELSTRAATQARNRLVWVALGAGISALLAGTALAWLIARSLAQRVKRVADASTAVAAGNLDQTLTVTGSNDEIGVLSHGFNAMLEQLRHLITHIRASAREEKARLERLVSERTAALDRKNRDLQLVLDNVDQGFITVDRDAQVVGEHSRIIDAWLGSLSAGQNLWDYLDRASPGVRLNFSLCWGEVVDGVMPLEVTLYQMPQRLDVKGRHLRLEYKPLLGDGEDFEKMLIILSDVTAQLERERSEQEERDVLNITSRLLQDRAGFLEFFAETENLVKKICENKSDSVTLKRDLHTLKGNSAIYGLLRLSALCHELENDLETLTAGELECSALSEQWQRTSGKLKLILGDGEQNSIAVATKDYNTVLDAVKRGVPSSSIRPLIEAWRLEPLALRLARVGEQLTKTVERVGKGQAEVDVATPRIYLAREELAEFWSVFSHVIRNAAIHGLESPEERSDLGKPPIARFALSAGVESGRFYIELRDSGPGVDWERVRERAAEKGMPSATPADLERALFADGISTERDVNQNAGRGVGLSAVREVCLRQGGTISVASTRGVGAAFRFSWPAARLRTLTILEGAA
ncbi:MAG: HAMP domain-containing protein [Myxococcota bacterium]